MTIETDHRHKVLIVDPVHPLALEAFNKDYDVVNHIDPNPETLRDLIQDVDAVVMRSGIKLTPEIIEAGSNLKVIARAGVGIDNIDIETAKERSIRVFNVPDISHASVAEFGFGLLFSICRNIALGDRQVRDNVWKKGELYGIELSGKTIGVMGYGNIGSKVGKIAQGVGMKVLACVNSRSPERDRELEADGVTCVEFPELLASADIVSLNCPLTDATRDLIGAAEFSQMKPKSILVNLSRGGVVDETALYDALKDKLIFGAASDVFKNERQSSPLFELDNFVATPHIGAMTFESQEKIARILVENLKNSLANKTVPNQIC